MGSQHVPRKIRCAHIVLENWEMRASNFECHLVSYTSDKSFSSHLPTAKNSLNCLMGVLGRCGSAVALAHGRWARAEAHRQNPAHV